MKYIKATLVFKIDKSKLTPEEQSGWREQFDGLRQEMLRDTPKEVAATLQVEEVEE